jgi:hypothetical protein
VQFFVMVYAVVVAFVLVSAERNRRDMRPHGPGIDDGGPGGRPRHSTIAVLLGGWAMLYASGYITELPTI